MLCMAAKPVPKYLVASHYLKFSNPGLRQVAILKTWKDWEMHIYHLESSNLRGHTKQTEGTEQVECTFSIVCVLARCLFYQ